MVPKGTTAYLLTLASLTLIPVTVILTTPTTHAMVPFNSYQDLQDFVRFRGCPTPLPSSTYGPGPATFGRAVQSNSASSQTTPSHSETNQQVSGVDELDTVKSDGQYVYTITNNSVAIILAYPTSNARLVSKVNVSGNLQ